MRRAKASTTPSPEPVGGCGRADGRRRRGRARKLPILSGFSSLGARLTAADVTTPDQYESSRSEIRPDRFAFVRVTDIRLGPGGRVYLVERGLDEKGAGADAALRAVCGLAVLASVLVAVRDGGDRVLRRPRVRRQQQSRDELLDQLGVLVGCPAALVGEAEEDRLVGAGCE
jgi:hypothetical protein